MAKKVKSEAVPYLVPQDKDQASEFISEIGRLQRERDRIEADMNDEIAKIKERYEAEALPHAERIKQLSSGVQLWCEANRDELTQEGKVKYAVLASGKINWRNRPSKVTVRGAEAVIQTLKAMGLGRFVRTIEEVNKEAMLLEPEVAKKVPGITISKGEDFVITPHETQLEEVA
jgi:phage host-nuclease inhibitor protein Gam